MSEIKRNVEGCRGVSLPTPQELMGRQKGDLGRDTEREGL